MAQSRDKAIQADYPELICLCIRPSHQDTGWYYSVNICRIINQSIVSKSCHKRDFSPNSRAEEALKYHTSVSITYSMREVIRDYVLEAATLVTRVSLLFHD